MFFKVEFGVLASAFFWSYALMQIPSGMIVDKLGTRLAYGIALIWWSIATVFTGIANTFAQLIGSRVLMGVGEAPSFPANARVMSEWMPAKERGKANALVTAGMAAGSGLLSPIVAWLIVTYGWRTSFIICGAVGIAFTILWALVFRSHPSQDKAVNKEELEYITAGQPKQTEEKVVSTFRWHQALKYKEIWVLCFGLFVANYLNYLMLAWFPSYLVSKGMTLMTAGFASMAPYVAMFAGAIAGGSLSDYLINKKNYKPVKARKVTLTLGTLVMFTFILPAPYVSDNLVALILMSGATSSVGLIGSNCWAIIADIAPKSAVGGIAGFQNFLGQFPGVIAPIVTGFIVQYTGSYTLAFNIPAVFAILAAGAYIFGLKDFEIKESDI